MKKRKKIICVVGPTASGKTKLAVGLAKKFDGEILSADSRQVFRGLDIGTGKDLGEYDNIAYHLIDIKDPGEEFTLFDFLDIARIKIEEIFAREKVPIVVGGTGLYVQALVEGFEISKKLKVKSKKAGLVCHPEQREGSAQIDSSLIVQNDGESIAQNDTAQYSREGLEKMSKGELQEILIDLDEEAFLTIDLANPYRIIRAIEKAQGGEEIAKVKPDFEVLQIGISIPRETLHEKIDRRVEEWFNEGFTEEIQRLLDEGVSLDWLNRIGLEYKILANYTISKKLKVKIDNDEKEFEQMKQEIKFKIHQYARRQMTWFNRFSEIRWVSDFEESLSIAEEYLNEV